MTFSSSVICFSSQDARTAGESLGFIQARCRGAAGMALQQSSSAKAVAKTIMRFIANAQH
jgi:hypothetical protein